MKEIKTLLFILSLPFFVVAQEKWEGGLVLGVSNYAGDLVGPSLTLKESNPAFGLFLRRHLTQQWALRANLIKGKISGDDSNYDELVRRNVSFKSSLTELSVTGEFDILGSRRYSGDTLHQTLSPYIFAGVGLAFGKADTDFSKIEGGQAANVQKDKDGVKSLKFAIPIGAGVKYDINEKITVGLEYGIRLVFSDYLDGVKATGNPDKNDVYFMGGLSVGYRFGE